MAAREDSNDPAPEGGGLAAVGARLAEVRAEQQLEQGEVALKLHLRLEVVQAIENGDAGQLPAMTFVRGYIKSYARLLELDDAALLAQLPGSGEHLPEPLRRVGMRRPGVSLHAGKWVLWGMVLALLALFVGYGIPALERLWSGRTTEPVVDQLTLPQAGDGDDGLALPVLPQEQPAPAPAAPDGTTGEAEPRPAAPEPAPAAEETTEVPVQPAPEQTGAAEAGEAAAGPAVIQLRFREDSWVEMEAQGRKLVVGIQRAGSERTVRAEPPVRILLGNAPGVEVIYRGEVVDITPYQRGKVARLTLED